LARLAFAHNTDTLAHAPALPLLDRAYGTACQPMERQVRVGIFSADLERALHSALADQMAPTWHYAIVSVVGIVGGGPSHPIESEPDQRRELITLRVVARSTHKEALRGDASRIGHSASMQGF